MDTLEIIKLIVSIVICLAAGGIGGFFTAKSVKTWYPTLKKPRFTPPRWLFGPVWTTLYILMGISVFFVWRNGLDAPGVPLAFTLFWVQLAVNVVWSAVFFGMRNKAGGLVVIVALWLLILAAILTSFQVSAAAGGLLIPYILWVSIATYLNAGLWRLNRSH